ncbi:MAG: molybdopterin-dependent oxidoreductase [Oligoflexus sp.]|nr:molybdopterin-dependent oxidoreductase [Oligoflexus sp.]
MDKSQNKAIKRVCNLCEAMCGLTFEFNDQGSYTIRGNKDDVFSKGAFCPKSQGLKDLHEDKDRLTHPLKRINNEFVRVSWDEALDDIASRINSIQKESGRSSVATYIGNPNAHNFGNLMMLPMFFKALRTRNKYSATSVDQLPHMLVAQQMFGHQLLLPIADIDHTQYLLILGANPAVSNGSLMSSAGLSTKIKRLKEGSGKVVVLDPRYTETASLASEHHFIRPGTDAFLLSAVVKILLEKPLKIGHVDSFTRGLDGLKELFADVDINMVSSVTGVAVSVIEEISRDLSASETAICYGRFGVSTQAFGTVCQWLINLINILTGNFDRQGGVLFTKPAFDVVSLMAKSGSKGSFNRHRSRVRNLPEFSGEYPSATLADEILTRGEGQVRAFISIAGNPVLSLPNGQKMEKALESLDFYVAIDIYQNETTRFADYILPPSSSLEHSHFDLVFNVLATRDTIRYSPAIVEAGKDSMEDWEILIELWSRIGHSMSWMQKQQRKWTLKAMRKFGTDGMLDIGLRIGPYKGLSLRKLKAQPDGIDLGALKPSLPGRLFTRDKKINLQPNPLLDAWRMFRSDSQWHKPRVDHGEFLLIGRRNLKSNNSWMHNLPSLHRSKDQCFVIMHKDDGEKLALSDGSQVRLSTDVGSIDLPVSLSTRIMPGVISVPHGWGHHRPGTRLGLAAQVPGVSLNDITDDTQIDGFSGNAVLNGQVVRIVPL